MENKYGMDFKGEGSMSGVIKMSYHEFLEKQGEFDNKTVVFIARWKDGTMSRMQRICKKEDPFCMYSEDHFEILEVEMLN